MCASANTSHYPSWGDPLDIKSQLGKLRHDHHQPEFLSLIKKRKLHSVFQPILDMFDHSVLGHEGLIRGPSESLWHLPMRLFTEADDLGLRYEAEHLARQVVLESFSARMLASKLFLNLTPSAFVRSHADIQASIGYLSTLDLAPNQIVIELTEHLPCFDYSLLVSVARQFRQMGFEIAMDDLGEGFSSLRLWSELRPDYVKIDKHFIHTIDCDPVKQQFVKSLLQIGENSGTKVIAEGIETEAELLAVRAMNVRYVQGYFPGKPSDQLLCEFPEWLLQKLQTFNASHHQRLHGRASSQVTVSMLCRKVAAISPATTNDEVFDLFQQQSSLQALPVIKQTKPIGLISRHRMIDSLARPFRHELFGKKSCTLFMESKPLIVDKDMTLQELSHLITTVEAHHLANGFIITESGHYLGMGTSQDLLSEMTKMQIEAARYANPLTMLPGNVPISEYMDRLLMRGEQFLACYFDLDHFKPFNDVYGFKRGDDLIQLLGKLLVEYADSDLDFVGHVGGDDFIVVFQSEDWESRCHQILAKFEQLIPDYYAPDDRMFGGIRAEDRTGNALFYPFVSISIGAVGIDPGVYSNHYEIATATAYAKKQAKKLQGNSLFLERRSRPFSTA